MTEIFQEHYVTAEGEPYGGETVGVGFTIQWQKGLVGQTQNGAFVEDVIEAAKGRMEHYQETKFNCDKNALCIAHLEAALKCLRDRMEDRVQRGVANSHNP